MRFAILAAGRGERFRAQGITTPKPLLPREGKPLIAHLLSMMPGPVTVITHGPTTAYLRRHHPTVEVIEARPDTAGESLHRLCEQLPNEPVIITTVDSIFSPTAFASLIAEFEQGTTDALMGVTTLIDADDASPLYIDLNPDTMVINSFAAPTSPYISAGVYCLAPCAIDLIRQLHFPRLRQYQQALVDASLRVGAANLGPVIDLDHPALLTKLAPQ